MRIAILIATVCFSTASYAAPVTWSLTNVQFDDGAVATGTFVYDADTNQASAINITVIGGSSDISGYGALSTDPFTYSNNGGVGLGGGSLWFWEWDTNTSTDCPEGDCQRNFVVDALSSPLTNASLGTVVSFDLAQLSIEAFSNNSGSVTRTIVSGALTAVPIPPAVLLFVSALAGLGWFNKPVQPY